MTDRNAHCSSCGLAITWATTEAGRSMPVDRDASEDGNIIFHRTKPGLIRVLTKDQLLEPADRPRFKSHFATCPTANEHRNRKKKATSVESARAAFINGLENPHER